jgi:RNA polymerase sigma-70 factor (ECF subfamily)
VTTPYPLAGTRFQEPRSPLAAIPAEVRPDAGAAADQHDSWLAAEVQRLVRAGDLAEARERFGELITLHQRRASRIAHAYLRNGADADDAVQDAFVRVFTHIHSYDVERPFVSWFTRILINVCVDRQRARQRRQHSLVGLDLARDAGSTARSEWPDARVWRRQWNDALASALSDLPDRQRAVFVLCHYGDRTPAEVSSILGVRESTVRVHLFRAVHRLRAALQEWRDAR